jgi:hypothetical protein
MRTQIVTLSDFMDNELQQQQQCDDDNGNNHCVPTSSGCRLGGKGSLDNNDNYTDCHQHENQLPSSVPRMNKRQEQMHCRKPLINVPYIPTCGTPDQGQMLDV